MKLDDLRCSLLLLMTVFWFAASGYSQKRVAGVVIDSLTGESLPFANIQTSDDQVVTSVDQGGYFIISLPEGSTDSLQITYVGYRPLIVAINQLSINELNQLRLMPDRDLPTIEVTLPRNTYGVNSSILTPSITELSRVPVLLGEVDIVKNLALLPGISAGSEGSASLNIRGGNPNQTDLLIDGNRVYNVNHIGGFLSAVPAFGTKAVTVYKGGVPAKYGGRLSGVVDILLKEGRQDQMVKTFTLGLGTLQAGLEGPISNNATLLITGRYSYPTIIYNLVNSSNYKRYESGSHQTVGLHDFVAKYGHNFSRHKITASAFISGDRGFDQTVFSVDGVASDDFRWGNRSLSLVHQYRSKFGSVWTNSLQYLNYNYTFDSRQFPEEREDFEVTNFQRELTNKLNDLTVKTEFSQTIGRSFDVNAGLIVTNHDFRADVRDIYITGENVRQFERIIKQDTIEVAAHVSTNLSLVQDRMHLMIGVRSSGLGTALPINLEPRLRLSYNVLNSLYANASLDRHYQYIHQLTPEITIYPNELYLLAGNRFPVERSDQVAIGVGGQHAGLRWSVEAFQKRMDNLVRLQPGQERNEDFLLLFPDNVIGDGEGRVKGLEFYLKQDVERLSYSLAYTLSKSERRYDQVNDGSWFPFTFDRRHDVSATASVAVGNKWRVNASFVYQTGYNFTAPVSTNAFFLVYGAYNGARLSPFHLLNLSSTRSWQGKKHPNRYHSMTFSLYNVYNRANAYTVELIPTSSVVANPLTGQEQTVSRLRAVTRSLFPITPGINYTVTVK